MKTNITVAIPALNEEKKIKSTIMAVIRASILAGNVKLNILVIDDGSTDKTSFIVERLKRSYNNIKLIKNIKNLGLGASIRKAIQETYSNKFIFIPGDNDIPFETLVVLFQNAEKADIVMCYFLNNECRGRIRFIISNLFMLIYTSIFNIYVQYINGPAIYPAEELKKLKLVSTRFSIVAEINVKLLKKSLTFMEIPSYRQTGLYGSSSFSFKSLCETIKVLINNIFEIYVMDKKNFSGKPKRVDFIVNR
jgi:glycosyltransferase involved in cell wall biosynthesis